MLIALLMLFIVAAIAASYWFLIRPLLRRWSALKEFWASVDGFEGSFLEKIRELFDGLKIKLLARLMWIPTLIVTLYDYALPYVTGMDITPVTAMLPGWVATALPIAGAIMLPILIDWCRTHSSSPQPPGA